MTSADEIEARLLADPDDDGAWQAYAPWLRSQGDARSELIALAAIADSPAERQALAAQIDAERTRWTPIGLLVRDCAWRHGFVVGATFRVAGRSDARTLARVLADPRSRLLGRLRLVFPAAIGTRALAGLDDAGFGRLRVLQAGYHARGNRVLLALARQPSLHLRTLDLRHAGVTDDALLALAAHPQLRGLRALHLQHNRFTARGAAALAHSPVLSGLERLDVRYNAIGATGAAALAASPHLGALADLLVHADDLEPAGVHALASSTALPHDIVRYWRARDATT